MFRFLQINVEIMSEMGESGEVLPCSKQGERREVSIFLYFNSSLILRYCSVPSLAGREILQESELSALKQQQEKFLSFLNPSMSEFFKPSMSEFFKPLHE